MTAGRIARIRRHLGSDEEFLLTYGDGVGDIDITGSIAFHRRHGKMLTLTAVHPPGRFGEISLSDGGVVREFNEKPQTEGGWINGGYFVLLDKGLRSSRRLRRRNHVRATAHAEDRGGW